MKSTAPWILGYAGEVIGSLQKDQSPQAAGGHLPFKRRTIPVSGGEDHDGTCDTAAGRVGNSHDIVNCQQLSHSEVLPSNRSRKPSDYRILLGYNQLGSPTNSSRQMTVNKIILHENYNKFHHQGNDIALIQLHRPVAYSSSIFPACIPEHTTKVFQARTCWISGWGMLREDKFLPSPFPLQEAEVSLIDNKECETFFHTSESIGQYNTIKDDMICAGDVKNGKSICLVSDHGANTAAELSHLSNPGQQGDTGGPLVCSLNGSWYVVGLGNWSAACLEPISSPNIFTKVSYYSNWIKKKKEETPDADPFSAPADENASTLVGWRSYNTGIILKPSICRALLSSQVLLLQSIWFQIP
ncbi:serine protease 40-like isoform X1 [Microtus pennsylvanicus]|uniref:serine protease 40-like isoform X1 n=1 Tax=Microtus pennsylvanicus TaxID=10058 RepID=UPI003F6D61E2